MISCHNNNMEITIARILHSINRHMILSRVLSCRNKAQVAVTGQKCVHIVRRVRNRLSAFYLLWVLFQSLMLLANVTPARDVRNSL